MALLILRTMPIDSYLRSPVELLNQRKTNLPTKVLNLSPSRDVTRQALQRWPASQKENFDCRSGPNLGPFQPAQRVQVRVPYLGSSNCVHHTIRAQIGRSRHGNRKLSEAESLSHPTCSTQPVKTARDVPERPLSN